MSAFDARTAQTASAADAGERHPPRHAGERARASRHRRCRRAFAHRRAAPARAPRPRVAAGARRTRAALLAIRARAVSRSPRRPREQAPGAATIAKSGSMRLVPSVPPATAEFGAGHAAQLSRSRVRTLVVTSGHGGVGKSNLAANLAIALGARGARVVLVDGDLAQANLDLLLGVHPRCDLGHVLSGDKTLDEIVVQAAERVTLVPGAAGVPELAELDDYRRELLLRSLGLADEAARPDDHRHRLEHEPPDARAVPHGARPARARHARDDRRSPTHTGWSRSCSRKARSAVRRGSSSTWPRRWRRPKRPPAACSCSRATSCASRSRRWARCRSIRRSPARCVRRSRW